MSGANQPPSDASPTDPHRLAAHLRLSHAAHGCANAASAGCAGAADRPRLLLIGSDADVQPVIRLAQSLHRDAAAHWQLLVLLGADTFSFRARPSTILLPGIPEGVIACVPMLDEFGIASRLASHAGLPGCHDGDVTELAQSWLESLAPDVLAQTQLLAAGPCATLRAAARVAKRCSVILTALSASSGVS